MTKFPISPVARIGGEMGMKLTRAAFAVMIKCTDNVHSFLRLVEDVNFNLNFSTEAEEKKKWAQVISQLVESNHAEYKRFLKQWEQAS